MSAFLLGVSRHVVDRKSTYYMIMKKCKQWVYLDYARHRLLTLNHFQKKIPEQSRSGIHFNVKGWKTGFEPATSGTTIQRSNQLSYNHHLKRMQKYFFVMIQPKYFSNSINLLSHTKCLHQIPTFNSLAISLKGRQYNLPIKCTFLRPNTHFWVFHNK